MTLIQRPQTPGEYIAATLVEDPSISYQAVATLVALKFNVNMTRQGVARIAQQECPKLKKSWKKTNSQIKVYKCQHDGCSTEFKGERGYSGIHARFCKPHRSGKTS